MGALRHTDRPLSRKPGAGRSRKSGQVSDGPVDEAIVAAAARRFATQGVAATTMAQIAQDVGLGVSSVYYYFGNKAAILGHILDEINSVPLALLDAACAACESPADRLHSFVRADAAALCTFPYDINEIHRLAAADRATFERYWRDREELIERVCGLIAEGIALGELRNVEPRLAAVTLLSNDEASRNWFQQTQPAPANAETDVSVPQEPGTDRPAIGGLGRHMSPDEIGLFLADFALRALRADPLTPETLD